MRSNIHFYKTKQKMPFFGVGQYVTPCIDWTNKNITFSSKFNSQLKHTHNNTFKTSKSLYTAEKGQILEDIYAWLG